MKNYIAEFLGSFVLILVGVGSLAFTGLVSGTGFGGSGIGVLGVGLAFGIIVMSLIYTIGPISGCHINPAVTIGVLAIKGMKVKDAVMYIIAQIVGGIVAAAVLYWMFLDPSNGSQVAQTMWSALTPTHYLDTGAGAIFPFSVGVVFVLEILMGFILQIVILGSLGNKGNEALAGVSIGLVVAALIFISGGLDGAGINPIRSLSPAFFANNSYALTQTIVISIANIIGAVIGSFGFKWLATPKKA